MSQIAVTSLMIEEEAPCIRTSCDWLQPVHAMNEN